MLPSQQPGSSRNRTDKRGRPPKEYAFLDPKYQKRKLVVDDDLDVDFDYNDLNDLAAVNECLHTSDINLAAGNDDLDSDDNLNCDDDDSSLPADSDSDDNLGFSSEVLQNLLGEWEYYDSSSDTEDVESRQVDTTSDLSFNLESERDSFQ